MLRKYLLNEQRHEQRYQNAEWSLEILSTDALLSDGGDRGGYSGGCREGGDGVTLRTLRAQFWSPCPP